MSAQGGSPFDAVVRVALAHFLYLSSCVRLDTGLLVSRGF